MPMIGFQTGSEYRRRPGYCIPSGTCAHFLASMAQTNLCRFVMSARFSTMWSLAGWFLQLASCNAWFWRRSRISFEILALPVTVLNVQRRSLPQI